MYGLRAVIVKENLEVFLKATPGVIVVRELMSQCGMTEQEANTFWDTYLNETRTTLELVQDKILRGDRILEIGAGLCLFSLFLKSLGFEITALEPSIGGFRRFEVAKRVILDAYAGLNLDVLEIPAQKLSECKMKFDFIFSNNVLEHIPNIEEAWLAMCQVLAPRGIMLHGCPNYLIPYEPHLGIPVIKNLPRLSSFCFPKLIDQYHELWKSLNFITYNDVQRLAKDNGMTVSFKKGLLVDALGRLDRDPSFRERHSGSFIIAVYFLLKKLRLLGLLSRFPPILSTPMVFQCSRRG